jgi:glycosyltransferase involved in cell wall biosynthesis
MTGGVQGHARLLAAQLGLSGVKSFVITRRLRPDLPRVDSVDGIPIYRLPPAGIRPAGKYAMFPFIVGELFRRRRDFDIALVCGLRALGVPAVIACRALGKVCVLRAEGQGEMSGDYVSAYRKPPAASDLAFRQWIRLRNRILRRADAVVAISQPLRTEFLACGVPADRTYSIPNGIRTDLFRPASPDERQALRQKLRLPAEGRIVVYTGRLAQGKGLETLIKAWTSIAGLRGHGHLVLVGPGSDKPISREKALKSYVAENGLSDRVTFTGAVDNVHEYLQASDIFAFPTEYEAFGLSLVEAMSCGLPVVASRVGGVPDIVSHMGDGILVEPRDQEDLTRKLLALIDDPALCGQLGTEARRSVSARYSISVVADQYLQLMSALCRSHI